MTLTRVPSEALAVSCPTDDLVGLADLLATHPIALLPVGGVGDLGRAASLDLVVLVEIGAEGPQSAIKWRARLSPSTPLAPDPGTLLPRSWVSRHPNAYELARTPAAGEPFDAALWDDEDEQLRVQLFLPIQRLEEMPREQWLFANELVRKQGRAGRRFAPSEPTIVALPERL